MVNSIKNFEYMFKSVSLDSELSWDRDQSVNRKILVTFRVSLNEYLLLIIGVFISY